jgi:hypothetical protein
MSRKYDSTQSKIIFSSKKRAQKALEILLVLAVTHDCKSGIVKIARTIRSMSHNSRSRFSFATLHRRVFAGVGGICCPRVES